MSHWTYQPLNGKKTVPLKIHCPRSPVLAGTFPGNNCWDDRAIRWHHEACGKPQYLDGQGFIYCECDQWGRDILEISLHCAANNEHSTFASWLHIHASLEFLVIETSRDVARFASTPEAVLEYLQWMEAMDKAIIERA